MKLRKTISATICLSTIYALYSDTRIDNFPNIRALATIILGIFVLYGYAAGFGIIKEENNQ